MSLPAGYELEVVVSPTAAPEAFADAALSLLADPNGIVPRRSPTVSSLLLSNDRLPCGLTSVVENWNLVLL